MKLDVSIQQPDKTINRITCYDIDVNKAYFATGRAYQKFMKMADFFDDENKHINESVLTLIIDVRKYLNALYIFTLHSSINH
jgi:hypothetical protein